LCAEVPAFIDNERISDRQERRRLRHWDTKRMWTIFCEGGYPPQKPRFTPYFGPPIACPFAIFLIEESKFQDENRSEKERMEADKKKRNNLKR
jgi:hypothetical protein